MDWGFCEPPRWTASHAKPWSTLPMSTNGWSGTDELAGYEIKQRFYEIGSHAGLKELDQMLRATQYSKPLNLKF